MKPQLSSSFALRHLAFPALLATLALGLTAPRAPAQTSLGTALAFDGVDDSVKVPYRPALQVSSRLTLEFWTRTPAVFTPSTLIAKSDEDGNQRGWKVGFGELGIADHLCVAFSRDGTDVQQLQCDTGLTFAPGTWYHLAVTHDASLLTNNVKVYTNGILSAETTWASTVFPNTANLLIGGYDGPGNGLNGGANSRWYGGQMDEVRLWNVARTQADLTNTMRLRLAGQEPGLVACYHFDEATGIAAYDTTTNRLDGTLVNRLQRVPSYWWPVIALNSADPLTNECRVPFGDTGATVMGSPSAIAAGGSHNLTLRVDGSVMGWGDNSAGQTTIPASASNGVVAIAAGASHNLALKADGSVIGWGYNSHGQTTIPTSATNKVMAIAAGGYHSLALKADGSVVGWGRNDSGQITIPTRATYGVVAIAAGNHHTLALRVDGSVIGWGDNNFGQTTIPASASNGVVAVAAAGGHSLALKVDGSVVAWGKYNDHGQTTIPSGASNGVVAIAAAGIHNLALKADGSLVAWGYNAYGQTTIPANATCGVVAIAAGSRHSLALKVDGSVVGWGDSTDGQTNTPSSFCRLNLTPTLTGAEDGNVCGTFLATYSITNVLGAIGSATRIVVVADTLPPALTLLGDNPLLHAVGRPFVDPGATAKDLCAGDLTENIRVWGMVDPAGPGDYLLTYTVTDAYGHMAEITRTVTVGSPVATTLPASNLINGETTLNGIINPQGIEATAWFEWGSTIGNGRTTYTNTTSRTEVGSGAAPVALTVPLTGLTPGVSYHFRIVASNSAFVTRGAEQVFWTPGVVMNSSGTLSNECHVPFVDPGATVSVSPLAIAAGFDLDLALRSDGSVVCWGSSNSVPAGARNGVVAIAAGVSHHLALKSDGSVVSWGANGSGPVPAGASNGVVAIAAGGRGLALRADGSVIGWGIYQETIPAGASNGVVAIATCWGHSLALKTNGSVVGWGDNTYGQITIPASASSGVVAIAAGQLHSLALKADGSVVGWGDSSSGQITVPVGARSGVVAIAAGYNHSLALKADGSVIGWGANAYGESTIPASARSGVVAITAGLGHSLALKADGSIVRWGDGQPTIPASVNQVDLPLSVSGAVDADVCGTYLLTYSATNALGGVGTATRTVVVGGIPPVLTLLGDTPIHLAVGDPFIDPGATASDLCAGDLTGSILISGTVDTGVPGSNVLTYTVSNTCGHTTEVTRTVAVGLPVVTTLPASDLVNDAATLNGTVNPQGAEATAWFEWGSQLRHRLAAPASTTAQAIVGSGTSLLQATAPLTGLTPGAIYHCRIVVSNSGWVTRGAEQVFWTPAMVMNSPGDLTHECHVPFVNAGAMVKGNPLAVAAGGLHSLALKADGSVVGWGAGGPGTSGSLHYGQTTILTGATHGIAAIAAGYVHSLALKTDGSVVGWGAGAPGTSGTLNRSQATIPASASNEVLAVAAGGFHGLALKVSGSVIGWGAGGPGTSGDPHYGQTTIPAVATQGVVAIAAGYHHSLALKANGSVVGWGRSTSGQTAIPAGAANGVVAIAAGFYHSLALRADGSVVGWGAGGPGMSGSPHYGQTAIPADASNGVVAIAAGGYHSLALKADGSVIAWGWNNYGQTTVPDGATNGVVDIAAGWDHSLALKADGSVVGWGAGGLGMSGTPNYGQTIVPPTLCELNLTLSVTGVDNSAPGPYLATYSTTNALGAVGTATRTVIVTDTRSPVLTLLGDNPLTHALGRPFVDPGATASDLCAGDLTGSILLNSAVNPDASGTYTNTFRVTDASGNSAVTNRTVLVLAPPVFASGFVPAPGQFHLQATGTAGSTYTLQTSTNLVDWVNRTNVVAGPGGLLECLMVMEPDVPACFYRLK